jgi:5-methylthioribose kinase
MTDSKVKALPKLRVQVDWFSDSARIHVEANSLRYLPRITPPNSTPALLFEDMQQHLLAMEAVPEPHDNWKEQLLSGTLHRDLVWQFGRLLATIHRITTSCATICLRSSIFESPVFFETLRLEPYYQFNDDRVTEDHPPEHEWHWLFRFGFSSTRKLFASESNCSSISFGLMASSLRCLP